MGSHSRVLQLLTPLLTTPSSSRAFSATRCGFSANHGGRSGGLQWHRSIRCNARPRFDAYDDDGFAFSSSSSVAKQRVWWSDDDEWPWEDDDDDGEDGFGPFGAAREESIGFDWIFKLVRAFSWILPAIIISMLLGTGPNSFIQALALPIAQTAVSLVIDIFREKPSNSRSSRPKSRAKKRPFSRPARNSELLEREENDAQTGKSVGDYQSWVAGYHVSVEKEAKGSQSFGGWDELDRQGPKDEVPKTRPSQNANGPRRKKKGKPSRRTRKRESPWLLRLLIDVFPFFGFWTKLM